MKYFLVDFTPSQFFFMYTSSHAKLLCELSPPNPANITVSPYYSRCRRRVTVI